MAQEEISQVDKTTKLLSENPGVKVVRAETGDLSVIKRDPRKPDNILQTIGAFLIPEPTTKQIGMRLMIHGVGPKDFTEIDVFPKDSRNAYFIMGGKKISSEEIFELIRAGIKLINAYKACPPDKRDLFLIKDPNDPYVGEGIVEDMLRQDADYLSFMSNEELNPQDVVEKIASRKTARQIGLSSAETDPFPSERILVMEKLLGRNLEERKIFTQ